MEICYNKAMNNRRMLVKIMEAAGFVNYPTEWWHWSYGDRYWAAAKGNEVAIYDLLSDKQLIEIVVENRGGLAAQAFHDLWARYERLVDWIISQRRYAFPEGWYSPAEHEDIKQEISEQVYKSLRTYKGLGSFSSWVSTISARITNKHIEKAWEISKHEMKLVPEREEGSGENNSPSISEERSPEKRAMEEAQSTAVASALGVLAQQKAGLLSAIALKKRYYEGSSWSDIGTAIGYSANSAEKKAERNLSKLRQILQDLGWGSRDLIGDS